MSLDLLYHSQDLERQKEIQILSCEQICGKHLHLNFDGKSLHQKMIDLQKQFPDKINIRNGKNSITISMGNTPMSSNNWYFILGVKSSTKRVNLLCLKNMLWGIDMSSGLRMKKSIEKFGKEEIATFLLKNVHSIFNQPETWQEIQFYTK